MFLPTDLIDFMPMVKLGNSSVTFFQQFAYNYLQCWSFISPETKKVFVSLFMASKKLSLIYLLADLPTYHELISLYWSIIEFSRRVTFSLVLYFFDLAILESVKNLIFCAKEILG